MSHDVSRLPAALPFVAETAMPAVGGVPGHARRFRCDSAVQAQAALISAAAVCVPVLPREPAADPVLQGVLLRAIAMDSLDAARQAVRQGADPNARLGSAQRFPLCVAVQADRPGMVRLLLRAGAQPNVRDAQERTPLMMAARIGSTAMAKALMAHGAVIDARDSRGQTALMDAAGHRHSAIVDLLLRRGAQPDRQNRDGETALMMAADAGDYASIEQLVQAGADPDIRDARGRTAIDRAVRHHRCAALATLVCFGQVGHGQPAISSAMRPAALQARVEGTTADGQTALMLAAKAGDLCLMDLLIRDGVQLDKQDGHGETALMKAAYYGQTMAVDLLLARGANVHVRSHGGESAVDLARKGADSGRHRQVIASLRAAEAGPPASG